MTTPFSAVLIGEEPLLAECGEHLLTRGHQVTAVVTADPGLRRWAAGHGLAVVDPGRGLAERLRPLRFAYLFSITNLRMLSDDVLALPERMPVNFHDGPLPRHAGLHATSWAVLEGATEHGVTWHVMEREADTGDVLKQRAVPVAPDDTAYTLNLACYEAAAASFGELVDELASGTETRSPQDLTLRTYHGLHDGPPREGLFSWRRPAGELDALVRATTLGPHRNAFGLALLALGERLFAVRSAEVTTRPSTRPPGTVLAVDERSVVVATADLDVRLTELVDLDGGTPAREANGLRPGDRFTELDDAVYERWTSAARAARRHEAYWLRRLTAREPLEVPWGTREPQGPADGDGAASATGAARAGVPDSVLALDEQEGRAWLLAALLLFLGRMAGDHAGGFDVGLRLPAGLGADGGGGMLMPEVPFRSPEMAPGRSLTVLKDAVAQQLTEVARRSAPLRGVRLRDPRLRELSALSGAALPVTVDLTAGRDTTHGAGRGTDGPALTVRLGPPGEPPRSIVFEPTDPRMSGAAHQLAARFGEFLRSAADLPDEDAGLLPLLTADESRQVLDAWNDTAADYPSDRCVHQLFEERSRRQPDAPAVRFGESVVTYGELARRSDQLAHRLVRLGAGPGTLVGVFLHRSADLLTGLLAVLKTGAAYVPLDPVYPPERIRHMLQDSGALLVLTESALSSALPKDCPSRVVELDAAHEEPTAGRPVDRAEEGFEDRASAKDPAYVIYTSGSTGLPKGVRVGHRALTNFLCSMAREPGFDRTDTLLAVTTACFDIAGLELFLPLVTGGQVQVAPAGTAADGFELRELIEACRPTVMQATPVTWRMLIEAGWQGGGELTVLCGGEALPDDLAADLVRRAGRVWNMYGPTETTIWSSVDRVAAGQPVTIGRPLANTRMYVLDERLRPVPPGAPGELYIGGDGVADGYHRRPELTARKFLDDPFAPGRLYRTGDLVRHLPDGRIEYLRRADNQVKLHGYRIELGEVETVLRDHPAVAAAAVVVHEDEPGAGRLVAYAVPSGAGPLPVAELRDHVRARLPAYMVPGAVVALGDLPLTPNGKLDRKALPAPDSTDALAGQADDAAPESALERQVAGIWQSALGPAGVGVDVNFFDAGGDSLRLTQVVARLRAELRPSLSRLDMFRHPTIRTMARHLAEEAAGARPPTPERQPTGRGRSLLGARRRRSGTER
ncbi:amino acid adenylation domain-containing protein [Streptomyces kanamyceticus]|uniref:amino acid adenylation domain-containing protein n=1 Tax=Streptomyces kanamyceticus TaxID=1967 RepID=UPI0006E3A9F9|nr:amino acid adenylation domain-containing protein [Streptomyces kanamyceticus]